METCHRCGATITRVTDPDGEPIYWDGWRDLSELGAPYAGELTGYVCQGVGLDRVGHAPAAHPSDCQFCAAGEPYAHNTEPETITPTYLAVRWSTSRGRDTYGWNICTVTDQETGKRFQCKGGGYDMLGTSFADWLQDTYQGRLLAIANRAHAQWTETETGPWDREYDDSRDSLYGFSVNHYLNGTMAARLDGACGIESIRKVAEAIGLALSRTWDHKGNTTGWVISAAEVK